MIGIHAIHRIDCGGMNVATRALFQAISDLKIDRVKAAIEQDCDLEATNDNESTALDWLICMYQEEEVRFDILELLIRAGANVNRRLGEGHGYAVPAIVQKNLRLLKLLLEHGYDPNFEPTSGESAYDWAVTDYIFDYWEEGFPKDPTDNDRANEDRFLGFLEKISEEYQVTPPIFVRELRKAGALSYRELEEFGLI